MNNKPFWQGKTCKEMAGLHVKVTFNSGTIVTGVTNMNGDIPEADNLSGREGNEKFVPYDCVKSIELLDDPEYERIDDIHDVCKGDIFVATNGNRFSVAAVDDDDEADCTLAVMVQAENPDFHAWMFNSNFAYALRPKPTLPDKPGLWLDKDDNTWVMGEGIAQVMCIGTDKWSVSRPWVSLDGVQVLNAAPFRPAKAVEA